MYIKYDEALKKVAEHGKITQREAREVLAGIREGSTLEIGEKVLSYDANHTPKYRLDDYSVDYIAAGKGACLPPVKKPSFCSRITRWWQLFFPTI